MADLDSIFNPQSLSKEEYTDKLTDIVKEILQNEFPDDKTRQTVKKCHNRIQFCCPCCGDSLNDSHKKRGNIATAGKYMNMYKCFNCGAYMPVSEFLKKYYHKSVPMQMIDYMSANKGDDSSVIDRITTVSAEIFNQEEMDRYAWPRETFKKLLNLEETDGSVMNDGFTYLRGRCQTRYENFLYDRNMSKLYVLNLTRSGKIFGVQIRTMGKLQPNQPKYKTYSLSNIYNILLKKYIKLNVEIPAEFDTLSMIFNSMTVDYGKPIIVTEGPMDAFLLKNAIATCGASKEVPFAGNFKYLYDDDNAGRIHTAEKIKDGVKVFLWSKFKKEYNIPYAKKWDVNDIVKYSRKEGLKYNFYKDEFWSGDLFDTISI